jgi:excisionase family DNA binding protein
MLEVVTTDVIDISAAADSTPIQKFLYTRHEGCKSIGVSLRSLDYLISAGEIKIRRVGKKVLVPTSELAKFARADHKYLTKSPDEDAA